MKRTGGGRSGFLPPSSARAGHPGGAVGERIDPITLFNMILIDASRPFAWTRRPPQMWVPTPEMVAAAEEGAAAETAGRPGWQLDVGPDAVAEAARALADREDDLDPEPHGDDPGSPYTKLAAGQMDPRAADCAAEARDPFAGLTNMLGPIDPAVRARLAKVVTDPSEENWDGAHSAMIGNRHGARTLWQAVVAVDPTFPKSRPRVSSADGRQISGWPKIPDSVTLMRAIRHAKGKAESLAALLLGEASSPGSGAAAADAFGLQQGLPGGPEKSDAGTESTDPKYNPCPLFFEGFCRIDGRVCPYQEEEYRSCGKYYLGKSMRGPLMTIPPGGEDDPRPGMDAMGGA